MTKAIEDRRERERARGESREIGEKCIESREIRSKREETEEGERIEQRERRERE